MHSTLIYVFLGPTLPEHLAAAELEATFLPPAAQGDVYRAALRGPKAIGIVDGFFEGQPSIWHKEILWAMSRGISVFGSASMGAIRAAELHTFGMDGIGKIFADFRDGVLTDDDEVAVAHGDAGSGYRLVSEAMVNIRRTLSTARDGGVISAETAEDLTKFGKALFYPERSYSRILQSGKAAGLPASELAALTAWIPSRKVDLKREDACAMLRAMRACREPGFAPKEVTYRMESTSFWENFRESVGTMSSHGEMVRDDRILDELRLKQWPYLRARAEALQRFLLLREASRTRRVSDADKIAKVTERFQQPQTIGTSGRPFGSEHIELSAQDFKVLMAEQALVETMVKEADSTVMRGVPDALRVLGTYERWRDRAALKQKVLENAGLAHPSLQDTGLTEAALHTWHFNRLRSAVPEDIDAYAISLGFVDGRAFFRAILREYCFLRLHESRVATDRIVG